MLVEKVICLLVEISTAEFTGFTSVCYLTCSSILILHVNWQLGLEVWSDSDSDVIRVASVLCTSIGSAQGFVFCDVNSCDNYHCQFMGQLFPVDSS
jgi:hypothetical protein